MLTCTLHSKLRNLILKLFTQKSTFSQTDSRKSRLHSFAGALNTCTTHVFWSATICRHINQPTTWSVASQVTQEINIWFVSSHPPYQSVTQLRPSITHYANRLSSTQWNFQAASNAFSVNQQANMANQSDH